MLLVMIPVVSLSIKPAGQLSVLNSLGLTPVAGIRYKKGLPGRQPYTLGPLICGCKAGSGVNITSASRGG